MPRGAKRDRTATKSAKFADQRSFIGLDGKQYLRGPDMSARRSQVFERDRGICQVCGIYRGLLYGETDHIQGGTVGRCDDLDNLRWICKRCHRARHVRVQWTQKVA